MQERLLACSNCAQGAADKYWWLTGLLVLVALVAAVALLARLRSADTVPRIFGLVAVAVLAIGVVLSVSTLAARIHVVVGGISVSCGSALTSAETTGAPNSSALDKTQLACRQSGRQHLRNDLPTDITVAAIGLLATALALGASFRRTVTPTAWQ